MPRPSSIPRRSGRFINKAVPVDTIIAASASLVRIYRFHNTHRRLPLSINVGVAATNLAAGGSIDLTVSRAEVVSVGKGQGVYDLLTEGELVRSGIFKASAAGDAVTIAKLGSEERVYRIINSSEGDIVVSGVTIAPESSADVVLTGSVDVTSSAGVTSEGVFDLLAKVV